VLIFFIILFVMTFQGEFDPSLASAIDVGKELKILTPSPISSEYISPWESILTKCKVKDLHPGYVVVKLFADSFADLDPDVESVMYPVTQCPHKLPCGESYNPNNPIILVQNPNLVCRKL